MATSNRLSVRGLDWLLSRFGLPRTRAHADELRSSSTRLHDRAGDLQPASDKLGRLLFEVSVQLNAFAPEGIFREIGGRVARLPDRGRHAPRDGREPPFRSFRKLKARAGVDPFLACTALRTRTKILPGQSGTRLPTIPVLQLKRWILGGSATPPSSTFDVYHEETSP